MHVSVQVHVHTCVCACVRAHTHRHMQDHIANDTLLIYICSYVRTYVNTLEYTFLLMLYYTYNLFIMCSKPSTYMIRTHCMFFSRQLQLQGLYHSHPDHMVSVRMFVAYCVLYVNAMIMYFTLLKYLSKCCLC